MVYGWTVVVFFWKLPSLLLILYLGEILAVFSYALLSALAESMFLLGLVTAICLLPILWDTQENFVVRGTWLALSGYGSIMLIMKLNGVFGDDFVPYWWWVSPAGLLLTGLLAAFSPRVKPLRNFALGVADRFQVFLFIIIPLSTLALVTIVLRNLS